MNYVEAIQSITVIIAALTAIYGIDSWRREARGRRLQELAEEVLALFYQARDHISFIRCIVGFSGEGSTRASEPDEDPDEKAAKDNAYVVFERYKQCQDTFNRLRALKYRFMALFSPERAKPFDEIHGAASKVLSSARMLAQLWPQHGRALRRPDDKRASMLQDTIRKQEAVFWEGEENDPIKRKVDSAVSDMEKVCGRILNPPSSVLLRTLFMKRASDENS